MTVFFTRASASAFAVPADISIAVRVTALIMARRLLPQPREDG
jgi:hypothetical protein